MGRDKENQYLLSTSNLMDWTTEVSEIERSLCFVADEAELERNPPDLQLPASPDMLPLDSTHQPTAAGQPPGWGAGTSLVSWRAEGQGLFLDSPGEAELPGCPDPYVSSSFIGKKRVSEGGGWMARSWPLHGI